jgi:hypothetical protein
LTLDLHLAYFRAASCKDKRTGEEVMVKLRSIVLAYVILAAIGMDHLNAGAADKLPFIYTARVMSQAYPWIAQEAGLFKKYDLDVPLIFVTAGAPAVATILAGDSEVTQQGAAALSRAFVQGNKDVVFIGGIKSILTHSIIAKPTLADRRISKENASACHGSAAIRTTSPFRRCAISAWIAGTLVISKPAAHRRHWPRSWLRASTLRS